MKRSLPSVVMLTADRQIDRRILLEADSLESAGWDVTIVAMPQECGNDDDRRVVRIGTSSREARGAHLVLDIYRWVRGHLPVNGRLMWTMKRWAWRYLVDPESFYLRLFSDTVTPYSPDVFVGHDLPMLPLARQAAARCGAKLVYDSHELYSEQAISALENRRWAEIERKCIGACDAVITVNSSIAQELQRRYELKHVTVVYNAERSESPPASGRYFNERFGLDPKSRILLYQGGLSVGRHIETLVEAMQAVRNPTVHLVVLGSGQLGTRLRTMVDRLGLTSRVHMHAAVPQRDLLGLTASADAGVIPYQATCLNHLFCTPNKLFEFIAAGVPILASELPEIRRILYTYRIGMVGDLSTPARMATLIDDFFSDDARLQQWHANVGAARKEVCWEREGEKVVSVFEAFRGRGAVSQHRNRPNTSAPVT